MQFLGGVVVGLGLAHAVKFHNGWSFFAVMLGAVAAFVFSERIQRR